MVQDKVFQKTKKRFFNTGGEVTTWFEI